MSLWKIRVPFKDCNGSLTRLPTVGVCAGMLWTAQGSMVLAYATEQTKGRLFALFW